MPVRVWIFAATMLNAADSDDIPTSIPDAKTSEKMLKWNKTM